MLVERRSSAEAARDPPHHTRGVMPDAAKHARGEARQPRLADEIEPVQRGRRAAALTESSRAIESDAGGQERQIGPKASRENDRVDRLLAPVRSEEHTSELQSLMRISHAVFCL